MILKNRAGITLISLVVTIIVLLILAGVTINLTLGQNGIFTIAQKVAQNYTQAQNQELSYLEGFTNEVNNIVNPAPLGTIIRTENGVNYIADGAGNTIPVPVGFSPIATADQGTKDTGFVIKNDNDNNEFVWVPVKNIASYQRIAWDRADWEYKQGVNGVDKDTESIKITKLGRNITTYYFTEKMPLDEKNSVENYKGFYIGRYEAGVKGYDKKDSSTSGSTNWTAYTGDNTTLVVQNNEEVWNQITRDKAKEVAENLYIKSNNVKSKLCSSYAWDTALKFIETNNSTYPINSVGGNYGTGNLKKTGYHKINNIYDMGGNTWEWTTEFCSNENYSCVYRGGDYWDCNPLKQPASDRYDNTTTAAYSGVSFRVTLYIQ